MVRSGQSHNNASRPRRSNSNNSNDTNNQEYLNNDCHRIYSCVHCRAHLANHDELISTAFQGTHGRAYLFNTVVNVGCGPAVQRQLTTGLHDVADIYCDSCKITLGWKYKQAFEASQKYKEGKYIIELAHMLKENSWDLTSYNCKDITGDVTRKQEQILRDRKRCPNYNPWPAKQQQSCDDHQQYLTPPATTNATTAAATTTTTNTKNKPTLNNKNLSDTTTATVTISRDNQVVKDLSASSLVRPSSSSTAKTDPNSSSRSEYIGNQITDKKIMNDINALVDSETASTCIMKKYGAVCDQNGLPSLGDLLLEKNHNQTRPNQFLSFHVPTHLSGDKYNADHKEQHNEQSANTKPHDGRDSDLSSQLTSTSSTTHTTTNAIDIKQAKTTNNIIIQRNARDLSEINNLSDLHLAPSFTSASSCTSSSSSSSSPSENLILSSSVSSTSSSASSSSSECASSTSSASPIQSRAYLTNASASALAFQLNLAQFRQPC